MSQLRNRRKREEQTKDCFDAICLSGGGIKGICTLGALEYFSRYFDLSSTKKYIGTSIGAVICLLLVCGYTPKEIFDDVMCEKELYKALPRLSFFVNFGLNDTTPLEKKLTKLVSEKFGKVPSLLELYEITGKDFVAVSANISLMRVEYIQHTTDPCMSCIEAVLLSCNAPGVFKKRVYNGMVYGDGGIFDNYPADFFDDGKTKILGIDIGSANFPLEIQGFFDYMHRLMSFAAVQNSASKKLGGGSMNIKLCVKEAAFNLSIGMERKIELFGIGHLEASKLHRTFFSTENAFQDQ
ncbi:putative patatin-like phospholipase [Insectomime virus]|uniref:Putative patatin-like phospholipase n=1 Tax=Tunisvirus fontaine2 TaxID=1421067 RepID=V9SEW7_9VIRU|nr:putative patatin-like phospholipase [Tunisvirus fontaine2]AHA46078.1 putative patatin-like phospholipase [Insectomime virus]AHC54856.1 putative patatin-like phospholipase [Tunisvirus fontaine2]